MTRVVDPAKSAPCHLAVECAIAIANYCLTRFPCDTPPHLMLDVPWFAEKVQKCIDEAATIGRNLAKSLILADAEIERLKKRVQELELTNSSAGAEPESGDSEHTENRSRPLVQSGGDSVPSKAGRTGGSIPPTGDLRGSIDVTGSAFRSARYVLRHDPNDEYPLQIVDTETCQVVGLYRSTSPKSAENHLNRLNRGEE